MTDLKHKLYGIDFSGAQDAGNKIWIAKGVPKGKGLLVKECFRARDLTNSGNGIEDCLPALVDLIKRNPNAIFGFDFPFGLPAPVVKEKSWEQFIRAFPESYKSPEAFRDACRQADGGHELKRQTDLESRTPFSPYNLRLFKQTYYGISKVLFPLVLDRIARILPFQEALDGEPWILEICPASTLKRLLEDGVPSYKGPEEDKRKNRRLILADVMKSWVVFGKKTEIKDKIIADRGGDALDSVIACLTVFKTLQKRSFRAQAPHESVIEGHIFV